MTRPDLLKLLTQIRLDTSLDQLEAMRWLIQKFPTQGAETTKKNAS